MFGPLLMALACLGDAMVRRAALAADPPNVSPLPISVSGDPEWVEADRIAPDFVVLICVKCGAMVRARFYCSSR